MCDLFIREERIKDGINAIDSYFIGLRYHSEETVPEGVRLSVLRLSKKLSKIKINLGGQITIEEAEFFIGEARNLYHSSGLPNVLTQDRFDDLLIYCNKRMDLIDKAKLNDRV